MKSILSIIILLLSLSCFCQKNVDEVFFNLKDGAILVRLESKQKTINLLEKRNPALAQKVNNKQIQRNQEIIEAFSNTFKYCPVYFFYDYNSLEIKKQNFKNFLFDKQLNQIQDLPELSNNYFIAAFGETMGDSINQQAKLETYDKDGTLTSSKDTIYQNHEGIRFNALILLTADLKIMEDPNPHFVRQNVIIRKRKPAEMVLKMQKKIINKIDKIKNTSN